jgi:TolA-binding protein
MDLHLLELIGQGVVFLAGLYAIVLRAGWNGKEIKDEMVEMKEEMKKLAQVITVQAVQTERIQHLAEQLSSLQREVGDLRRGNGWIQGVRGVDKEY